MAKLEQRLRALEARLKSGPAGWGDGARMNTSVRSLWNALKPDSESKISALSLRINAGTLTEDDRSILAAIPGLVETPEEFVSMLHGLFTDGRV